jgi:hypothetical protein
MEIPGQISVEIDRLMLQRSALVEILFFLIFLGMVASPARAQSTNAAPDLGKSDAPFDADKAPNVPLEAKQAVADALVKFKSGNLLGFVFVASPDFKVWAVNAAPKGAADFNLSDLARTTLEGCEYAIGQPCAIISINGFDTRGKSGAWPKQPPMRPGDRASSTRRFCHSCRRPCERRRTVTEPQPDPAPSP